MESAIGLGCVSRSLLNATHFVSYLAAFPEAFLTLRIL